MSVSVDWKNLGFSYMKTPLRFVAHYKDGQWDEGKLVDDANVTLNEAATGLHYGQQAFEGMKAYRAKDGSINLFRPDQNAKRLRQSCQRLLMPEVPDELFIRAVKETVKANSEYVAPYGSGATLYIRPYIVGTNGFIGVVPATEFLFSVFVFPVGAYFKGGLTPTKFIVSEYDRAAPNGTGAAKVGGNYAASYLPGKEAKGQGYSDCVYLDPATHTKIEEIGAANFFGITKDGKKFITPLSPSILPSITKYSLLYLAKERLGLEVEEGDVYIDQLDQFSEAGACGTAAVISPISSITYQGKEHVFYSQTEVGPITRRLYDELVGIQFGDIKAPEGWIVKV